MILNHPAKRSRQPVVPDGRPFSCFPEDTIIALAKSGDSPAFAELVHRNYARARRLAYLVARDHAAADDAVSESFCQAFTHLHQFESSGRFSSWLNRIIINECREKARSDRRASSVEFEERVHTPESTPEAWHTLTPEQQAGHTELRAVLSREIHRIPAHLREPFLMRVEDTPVHEIAARLGLTEGAVKARVNRARCHLRTRMARHLSRIATHLA
jgi:RNA polymerase sigma-70 factor (ECF subfamily)